LNITKITFIEPSKLKLLVKNQKKQPRFGKIRTAVTIKFTVWAILGRSTDFAEILYAYSTHNG